MDKIVERRKSRPRPVKDQDQEKRSTLNIPYIKGISDKIKRIGHHYNLNVVFGSGNSLRSHLTKTKPANQKDTKNCIYEIPCECGSSYVGETKRPLEARIKEHRRNTTRGETEKSGAAHHAWTQGHHMLWSDAKIIHREHHWRKRKFKEAAVIQENPTCFSKPSVDIRNVWKPLLNKCKLKLG